MKKVFITQSNMKKLVSKVDVKNKDYTALIKQYDENIKMILSKPELHLLSATKVVLETINESKSILEINFKQFKLPNEPKPLNSRWIHLGGSSAYHLNEKCSRLNQDYLNFQIPKEIPENRIEEYRYFFLDNMELLNDDAEKFYLRISMKFKLKTSQIRSIRFDNSGFENFQNICTNPEKIISEIKSTIAEMEKYRNSSSEVHGLIEKNGFATHRAKDYMTGTKFIELEGHPLKMWHIMKSKLKTLILKHLIITLNPELAFEQSILEAAGFKQCKECKSKKHLFR